MEIEFRFELKIPPYTNIYWLIIDGVGSFVINRDELSNHILESPYHFLIKGYTRVYKEKIHEIVIYDEECNCSILDFFGKMKLMFPSNVHFSINNNTTAYFKLQLNFKEINP